MKAKESKIVNTNYVSYVNEPSIINALKSNKQQESDDDVEELEETYDDDDDDTMILIDERIIQNILIIQLMKNINNLTKIK